MRFLSFARRIYAALAVPMWPRCATGELRRNYAALRYSALNQINTSNVKDSGRYGFFNWRLRERAAGHPIVIDGVMYLSTSNAWYSRSTASGRVIWEYHFTLGRSWGTAAESWRGRGSRTRLPRHGGNHMVALDRRPGRSCGASLEDSRQCGCAHGRAPASQDVVGTGVTAAIPRTAATHRL